MALPVIDVSSITISPNNLPCAVYGSITAFDQLDLDLPFYELFERDAQHPELITETGQALSIIRPDIILLMQQPVLSLTLKVKGENEDEDEDEDEDADDAIIARGTVMLDITTNNDYEEVKYSDVKGDCGHATVNYIALSCAYVARITIRLMNDLYFHADGQLQTVSQQDSDNEDDVADGQLQTVSQKICSLYGSIVAHYGKTFGRTDHFSIMLLNTPSDESIPLHSDHPQIKYPVMKLTRKFVAVPAYSPLILKVNLRPTNSSMSIVDDKEIILWPCDGRVYSKFRANCILPEWCLPVWCEDVFHVECDIEELSSLYPSSRDTMRKSLDWGKGRSGGEVTLEVFSVFIGRENDHDLNVCGSISVEYGRKDFDIFKRDDSNPDRLMDGRKLLTINRPFILEFKVQFPQFYIRVNLKDADNSILMEGLVDIETLCIDIEIDPLLFDRALCSVFQGDNGYCALHYAVFKSAARVDLKIVLLCKGVVDVAKVHGKVVAWSDIFDYTSEYEKKYYRTILYDEPDDIIYSPSIVAPKNTEQSSSDEPRSCFNMIAHNKIKPSFSDEYNKLVGVLLSESRVSVPVDHGYNISVDLYASSLTQSGLAEHFQKTLSFQFHKDKQMKMEIPGVYFDLHIEIF